jgi:AcrR family transcriptional regulator
LVSTGPTRRADARRNRQRLLEVALAALTANDRVSLDAIAREAGVGIGTLYRHFPSREALVEAVYRSELDKVCEHAAPLVTRCAGDVGLRRWMERYAGFVTTKRAMAQSLQRLMTSGASVASERRQRIVDTVDTFLQAGAADGTLREDANAEDVTTAMVGALLAAHDEQQSARLLDLLVDGLRPPRA